MQWINVKAKCNCNVWLQLLSNFLLQERSFVLLNTLRCLKCKMDLKEAWGDLRWARLLCITETLNSENNPGGRDWEEYEEEGQEEMISEAWDHVAQSIRMWNAQNEIALSMSLATLLYSTPSDSLHIYVCMCVFSSHAWLCVQRCSRKWLARGW